MAELSFRLIEVEPGSKLECERELHSKGHCYAAQDRRRQYLVLGQRVAAIRDIIREVVGEDVKLSSLYEAAAHELKVRTCARKQAGIRHGCACDFCGCV